MVIDLLRFYIAANALILACFVLTFILYRCSLHKNWLSARVLLKTQHWFLASCLALPVAAAFLPESELTVSSAQLWGEEIPPQTSVVASANQSMQSQVGVDFQQTLFPTSSALTIFFLITALGFFMQAIVFSRDLKALQKLARRAISIRSIGKVSVALSEDITTPCSFRLWGKCIVLIPSSYICCAEDFRIALYHEMQHHRQGDTSLAYYLHFMKSLFFINPFFHLWQARLRDVQELACDETLLGRKDVSLQAYGGCLLRAAKSALSSRHLPRGALGMASSASARNLKIRIKRMMAIKSRKNARFRTLLITTISSVCLLTVTLTTHGLARDRSISMDEAIAVVEKASGNTPFPIEINERILHELNFLIGTPQRRQLVRAALRRMSDNLALFEGKLSKYGHPFELLAVGLVESGYLTYAENQNAPHGAGVWQFIPSTARSFGLRVNESIDERLDLELATDAAMRYLGAYKLRFQDWRLAVLSYNAGGTRTQRGINELETRGPWELVAHGYEGDSAYLAKVMAAALILQNPEWVR